MALVRVGQVIGEKYEILRRVGKGGMGAVFEAKDLGSGARVAIKIVATADLTDDTEIVQRFQREAQAAGSIVSEHIVRVFDTGTDAQSGMPFMIMDLLVGQDLSQVMKRVGVLPTDIALRLAGQALQGLASAHAAGVIHRDVKPANLFLHEGGNGEVVVKILDFGIAKVMMEQMHDPTSGLTRTGSMLGSPQYMSPEQTLGSKKIDQRTDLWSVGIVLYKALTGATPREDAQSIGELMMSVTTEPPRPIQETAPWVPKEVAAIVHRALEISVERRYQSAAEMLADIQKLTPGGLAVEQRMLAEISTEERARVAAKLEIEQPNTASRLGNNTAGGVSGSQFPAPPPTSSGTRAAITVVGAILALSVGGFALHRFLNAQPEPTPPGREVAAATATASSAPAPVAAPTHEAKAVKTVKLTIDPGDGEVEVDGKKADVKDGAVELSGELGSVHSVKVTKEGREPRTADVVIAAAGPMPAAIQLEAAKAKRAPAAGPTATGAAGAPAAKGSNGKPPARLGVATQFD